MTGFVPPKKRHWASDSAPNLLDKFTTSPSLVKTATVSSASHWWQHLLVVGALLFVFALPVTSIGQSFPTAEQTQVAVEMLGRALTLEEAEQWQEYDPLTLQAVINEHPVRAATTDRLYQEMLGRSATEEEIGRVRAKRISFQDLVRQLVSSEERQVQLEEIYQRMLRVPIPAEHAVFYNEQPASLARIIESLQENYAGARPLSVDALAEPAPTELVRISSQACPAFEGIKGYAVRDDATGELLCGQGENTKWEIASMTKVALGWVFLQQEGLDLGEIITLGSDEDAYGSRSYGIGGNSYTVADVLHYCQVKSDNYACEELVTKGLGITEAEFAGLMTEEAIKKGLLHTRFDDVSGYGGNESTAADVTQYARLAWANEYQENINSLRSFVAVSEEGFQKTVETTARVMRENLIPGIRAAKTGYGFAEEGKHHLVIKLSYDGTEEAGPSFIAAVVGAETYLIRDEAMQAIARWVRENYVVK